MGEIAGYVIFVIASALISVGSFRLGRKEGYFDGRMIGIIMSGVNSTMTDAEIKDVMTVNAELADGSVMQVDLECNEFYKRKGLL
jgi:hypothetical protein